MNDILHSTTSSYSTGVCCDGTHVWVTSGGEATEGTPCSCGKQEAHYEACKECGTVLFKPRDILKLEISQQQVTIILNRFIADLKNMSKDELQMLIEEADTAYDALTPSKDM